MREREASVSANVTGAYVTISMDYGNAVRSVSVNIELLDVLRAQLDRIAAERVA